MGNSFDSSHFMKKPKPSITRGQFFYGAIEQIGYLEDLLFTKLNDLFKEHSTDPQLLKERLKLFIRHYTCIDLALALSRFSPDKSILLYHVFPSFFLKSLFFSHLSIKHQLYTLRNLNPEEVKNLLNQLSPQNILSIFSHTKSSEKESLFLLLDQEKRKNVHSHQIFEEGTAGRGMNQNFLLFSQDVSLAKVLQFVQDRPQSELQQFIFVNDKEGSLLGYMPIKSLFIHSLEKTVGELTYPIPHKLSAQVSYRDILAIVHRYHVSMLPVVNHKNQLIGIITQPQIIFMMEELSSEILTNLGGLDEETSMKHSVLDQCVSRSPWLFLTLIVGLINSSLSSFLAHHSSKDLLAFIPLILGVSGTMGIQCSSIILREMVMGRLTNKILRSLCNKELLSGALIGSLLGCSIALFANHSSYFGVHFFQKNAFLYSAVLGVSTCAACMSATLLGTLFPYFFSRCGIDPAVAAGPIIGICNDFFSLLIVIAIVRCFFSWISL